MGRIASGARVGSPYRWVVVAGLWLAGSVWGAVAALADSPPPLSVTPDTQLVGREVCVDIRLDDTEAGRVLSLLLDTPFAAIDEVVDAIVKLDDAGDGQHCFTSTIAGVEPVRAFFDVDDSGIRDVEGSEPVVGSTSVSWFGGAIEVGPFQSDQLVGREDCTSLVFVPSNGSPSSSPLPFTSR